MACLFRSVVVPVRGLKNEVYTLACLFRPFRSAVVPIHCLSNCEVFLWVACLSRIIKKEQGYYISSGLVSHFMYIAAYSFRSTIVPIHRLKNEV